MAINTEELQSARDARNAMHHAIGFISANIKSEEAHKNLDYIKEYIDIVGKIHEDRLEAEFRTSR